jgi:hypothetical protein
VTHFEIILDVQIANLPAIIIKYFNLRESFFSMLKKLFRKSFK